MNYTQIEDYDCPECEWSLHVEKRVWNEIDDHSLVINYIQLQVRNHNKIHESKPSYPSDIANSPYLYISKDIDK